MKLARLPHAYTHAAHTHTHIHQGENILQVHLFVVWGFYTFLLVLNFANPFQLITFMVVSLQTKFLQVLNFADLDTRAEKAKTNTY